MPFGVLLENSCGANDSGVVAGSGDELQTNGQFVVRETAGNRECGKSAKISNAAKRIGKRQISFEIGL